MDKESEQPVEIQPETDKNKVISNSENMFLNFQPEVELNKTYIESPFQKILNHKPKYKNLVYMLEDDSKDGEDDFYDALKVLLKARLLDQYPDEAEDAKREIEDIRKMKKQALEEFKAGKQKTAEQTKKELIEDTKRLRQEKLDDMLIKTLNQNKNEGKKLVINRNGSKKKKKSPVASWNLSLKERESFIPDEKKKNAAYIKDRMLSINTNLLIRKTYFTRRTMQKEIDILKQEINFKTLEEKDEPVDKDVE